MFDLESFLAPLSEDAPCGSDLEYDPVFLELQVLGAGKPEQQFGDTVIPAKAPDWQAVHERALDLAQRTRDLRVAVWLLRSGAQLQGWGSAVDGLKLLHGLLQRHWVAVHPQIDAGDPIMRVSALSALSPQELPYPGPPQVLADLRTARFSAERGGLTVREVELGLGGAEALPGEMAPTEAGMLQALRALFVQQPALAASIQAAQVAVEGINSVLSSQLDSVNAPDLADLRKLLATLAKAVQRATGATPEGQAGQPAAGMAGGAAAAAGGLNSRDDVVRTIDNLCDWIERHEPTNPAPLLLRRAQRLMNKNFLDIIRDIAPDGLDQIKRLAGRDDNE